jgi:DNA-binding transcriptional LysR family regulator
VNDPRLESRTIEQDELVLIVSASDELADSEVSPEDLEDRPFVMREVGSATRRAAEEGLATAGITPRVAMELGSNGAVEAAVAEGAGIGVVPARMLTSRQQIGQLHVPGLSFVRPFVLVFERNHKLSPSAEAFVSVCLGEEKTL